MRELFSRGISHHALCLGRERSECHVVKLIRAWGVLVSDSLAHEGEGEVW